MGEPTTRYQTFANGDTISTDFLNLWVQDHILALREELDALLGPSGDVTRLYTVTDGTALTALTDMVDRDVALIDSFALYQYNEFATDAANAPFVYVPDNGTGRWFMVGRQSYSSTKEIFVTADAFQPIGAAAGMLVEGGSSSTFYLKLSPADSINYTFFAQIPALRPGDKITTIKLQYFISQSGGSVSVEAFSYVSSPTKTQIGDTVTDNTGTGTKTLTLTVDHTITNGETIQLRIVLNNNSVSNNIYIYSVECNVERRWIK